MEDNIVGNNELICAQWKESALVISYLSISLIKNSVSAADHENLCFQRSKLTGVKDQLLYAKAHKRWHSLCALSTLCLIALGAVVAQVLNPPHQGGLIRVC